MLCPNCQSEFNSTTNLPRILIFCGHTFCHDCIDQLLQVNQISEEGDSSSQAQQNTKLNCPECGTLNQAADGVNSFPKNLVLLQMNNQQPPSFQNNQAQHREQTKSKENSQKVNTQQKSVCQIHNKKLEAFCEKDLQTLCIDCILSEQHKSHEIISVQKAVEKQKQFLYEEVTQAQKTEERLKFIHSDIKRYIGDMHLQAEKNRREISQIYNFVRELLLEREQALKRQISENLQREEQESSTKLQEITDFMSKVNQLKQELLSQNSESEIELLNKARQRQQVCGEINGQRSKELVAFSIMGMANMSQSLIEIKRDQELSQISKIVNPSFKGPVNQGIGLQNHQQSTLYSHTMASKMKRAGTTNPSTLQSFNNNQGNFAIQNQVNSREQLPQIDLNKKQEEIRKSGKTGVTIQSQMKSKISPHRALKKPEVQNINNKSKQSGVVVLDQNKQKMTNGNYPKQNKSQSSGAFNNVIQQHINLYNYNQNTYGQGAEGHNDEVSEDVIVTGMGADDVSSIYPLETNDYYYQYSPKGNIMRSGGQVINPEMQGKQAIKRDESVGALNDLLDSLNKSSNDNNTQQNSGSKQLLHRESSTASETDGTGSSNNRVSNNIPDPKIKQTKSNMDTPKQKKLNPWMAQRQKSKSNKKGLKKDNSTTDFEEFKNQQSKITSPQQIIMIMHQDDYYPLEETKANSIQRSGSLNRYNNNSLINLDGNHQNEYDDAQQSPAKRGIEIKQSIKHNLASLSQERNKRKVRKQQDLASEDQSPNNTEYQSPDKDHNRGNLMIMLQECTKNIEKLEFRPSAKKKQKGLELNTQPQAQESPVKQSVSTTNSKTAICLVDLTSKDDEQLKLKLSHQDDQALLKQEVDEDSQHKNIPNSSSQRDYSPFKNQNQSAAAFEQNSSQQSNSPNKEEYEQKHEESLEFMLNKFRQNETPNTLNNQQQNQYANQNAHSQSNSNFSQQNVSIDTSTADPFRALCRVKEEFIFVFSGFNEQKLLMCEALDVQRGVWKEITQIGKARTKFSAVPISKSRILLFGGKLADGQRTGEIEEYNLKTNKFKTLPFKLPKPRSGFAACVKRDEGKIFFCGGNSGSVLKKFDCLDLKKGKWSRWPEMIQKRDELAVALGPDGKIYAIGGYGGGSSQPSSQVVLTQSLENSSQDVKQTQESGNNSSKHQSSSQSGGSNCLRTAERFDFNTGQWEMLPEMNEARRALAAVALPDGIYAIGGYDGKQYLNSVEKFDLQKQQWIPVKSMNTSRCTLAAVASSDCQYIYALGGFNGNSLDLVERYNIMTDEWEFITPMNSKRFMHEAVTLITH